MKHKTYHGLTLLLLFWLILTVAVPMAALLGSIRADSIRDVLSSRQFGTMLRHSLLTTAAATAVSIVLSFLLALLMHRSHIRFKGVFAVLFTVPMLIPSISHGTGLVLLFGDNGILTRLLGINIGLYGYTGIILGSVLYSFPVAFLMFHDAFQYEDFCVYEAAGVLGIPAGRRFLKITLPYMAPTIASAALAVFTMIFTDYGIALMTGGTVMTLPVYMYREVIGKTDFSGGAVISLVLLMPALGGFLLDYLRSAAAAPNDIVRRYNAPRSRVRDCLIFLFFLTVVVLVCLPVLGFVCLGFVKQYPIDLSLSLDSVRKLVTGQVGTYLINSVAIALTTALAGVCLAYFSAYVTLFQKKGSPLSGVIHFFSMLPMAFPGLVLGLSFVLAFRGTGMYSTLFILIMVNIVHFFSSPYLLARNALAKFSRNIRDTAQTLGIGKMKLLFDVYLPSTKATIVEMYSYFFVNSMVTISAVSFLFNFRTMPLSLLIPQLESQSFLEGTALVSLMILGINLLEKGIAFILRRAAIKQES